MFEKMLKKIDLLDISLIKLASAAGILFIITIWPAAMELVQKINPWLFLIAALVFAARPIKKAWL